MSGSIKKLMSSNAMPLNKRNNILTFNIGQEAGQVDMKASYIELQISLDGLDNYEGVVLGNSGLLYNPACLFRRAGLRESYSGKVLQNLTYVNILSQNLDYYSKGCNQIRADTLFSGAGILSPDGTHYNSIFENDYQDRPEGDYYLRVPLQLLFPGSIGDSDMLPQQSDWTFDYLLEPQYKCFMRAFPAKYSDGALVVPSVGTAATSADPQPAGCTVWNVANGALFPVGSLVLCNYTVGGVAQSKHNYVTAVNVNALTFANALDVGTTVTGLTIKRITNSFILQINNFASPGGVVFTLTTPTPAPIGGLYVGGPVKISYDVLNADGELTATVSDNIVVALPINGDGNLTGITVTTPINLAAGTFAVNLRVSLATENLTNDYSVKSAHMVVYRRNVPMAAPQNMLVSNFESVNVAMVGGTNKFSYTIKMDNNTYNAFVLTPSDSNMYSTRSDNGSETDTKIIGSYLYYVDEKPLTNIILDANSSPHNENVVKTFSNSECYPLKNLRKQRDVEFKTDIVPFLFPSKIFPSVAKGEMNVQSFDEQDRNLKIDLYAADGATTPLKQVFIFLEKYDRV